MVLRRGCSCRGIGGTVTSHCGSICPVHILWPAIREKVREGEFIFRLSIIARSALRWAQARLESIIPEPCPRIKLHDFRRGAAQSLLATGCRLSVILKAGSWSSRAFMTYLDESRIEQDLMSKALSGFLTHGRDTLEV